MWPVARAPPPLPFFRPLIQQQPDRCFEHDKQFVAANVPRWVLFGQKHREHKEHTSWREELTVNGRGGGGWRGKECPQSRLCLPFAPPLLPTGSAPEEVVSTLAAHTVRVCEHPRYRAPFGMRRYRAVWLGYLLVMSVGLEPTIRTGPL